MRRTRRSRKKGEDDSEESQQQQQQQPMLFCPPTPEVVNEMNDDVDRGSAVLSIRGLIATAAKNIKFKKL